MGALSTTQRQSGRDSPLYATEMKVERVSCGARRLGGRGILDAICWSPSSWRVEGCGCSSPSVSFPSCGEVNSRASSARRGWSKRGRYDAVADRHAPPLLRGGLSSF